MVPIHDVLKERSKEVHLHFYEDINTVDDLNKVKELCARYKGRQKLVLSICCKNEDICFVEADNDFFVDISKEFLDEVTELLGERRFKLKTDLTPPAVRKRWVPKPKPESAA